MTDRHHFVFVYRCGCPFGLVEQTSRCRTEDQAWGEMYDTRAEERRAHAAGVHVVHVDHATYERELFPMMLSSYACTHVVAPDGVR